MWQVCSQRCLATVNQTERYGMLQVTAKKLKKYEREYVLMKEQQMQQENPIERFEVSIF